MDHNWIIIWFHVIWTFSESSCLTVAEVSGRRWRAGFGAAWNIMFFSFGGMIIPIIAYFVRDHFKLMAVFFWPLGLFFSLYLWVYWARLAIGCCWSFDSFVDESPRWLLSRQREKEAIATLNHVAMVNKGTCLPEDVHFKEEGFASEVSKMKTSNLMHSYKNDNSSSKLTRMEVQPICSKLPTWGRRLWSFGCNGGCEECGDFPPDA